MIGRKGSDNQLSVNDKLCLFAWSNLHGILIRTLEKMYLLVFLEKESLF